MMEIKDLSPKQRRELLSINSLLCKYGYGESADMCSDRPDICLPSSMNRRIGIEVTEYTNPNDKKAISTFCHILKEYLLSISERKQNSDAQKYSKEKKYCMTVWLHGGFFPRIDNIKQKKKQIFEELDRFAFPCDGTFINEYIASVEIEEILNPEITESIVRIPYVEEYSLIDEAILLNCIISKEEKLREYKKIKENNSIREFWLAIIISDPMQVNIYDFKLHNTIISGYNKIFIIKGIDCIRIK